MARRRYRPEQIIKKLREAEVGVWHHFALVHAEISSEIEKVARILNIKLNYLTD